MARGINKVMLIGNLGRDPETRYAQNGSAVTRFSIATSESWKDRTSGEQQERTEWHRIKLFGRQAELAGEYLKKGSQVYIEGRIQTSKYQDKDGNDRWSTEIVAREMTFLGGRGGGGGGGDSQSASSASPPQRDSGPSGDFDDDIPF